MMKAWVWVLGVVLFTATSCGDKKPQSSLSRTLHAERFRADRVEVACPEGAGDPVVIQEKRDILKSRYGITVDLSPQPDEKEKVVYEAINEEEMAIIQVYLTVAVEQLAKHPSEFFKAAEIKSFSYVKDPVVEGYPVTGLAMYDQGQLLFSVDTDNCATDNIADTLHHEMFHFFHGNPEPPLFEEADWAKLNEPGFIYKAVDDQDTEVNHPKTGFVSEYAMTSEGEDTAETFAAMMLGETARLVKAWSETDAILASKVAFLKKLMAKASPTYTDTYWEKILEEKDE